MLAVWSMDRGPEVGKLLVGSDSHELRLCRQEACAAADEAELQQTCIKASNKQVKYSFDLDLSSGTRFAC